MPIFNMPSQNIYAITKYVLNFKLPLLLEIGYYTLGYMLIMPVAFIKVTKQIH